MKKININFSWPATLSDFTLDTTQENFSRAKLAVFYRGETADHRYFSSQFSEDLVKSLPYTPIVSYYDAEEDDFVGHATEQQILGIVDPTMAPTFEEREDGNEWCICDVVLYTERPDMVGDLAKKVVGHSQSLELDPRSVKYVINYDEKKHFKNIEFTAGRFVGVSVLGKNQKPAFTGSEFFAVTTNDEVAEKMQLLKDYCNNNLPHEEHQLDGGQNMNLNEFIKLSWGEMASKVTEALCREYENDAFTYVVDMYDDSVIAHFCYYIGECKLMRVDYTIDENGNVQFGNVTEVHVTYEPVESPSVNMEQVEAPVTNETSAEENNLDADITEEEVVQADEQTISINADITDDATVTTNQDISIEATFVEEPLNCECAQSFDVEDVNSDTAIPGEMRVENEDKLQQEGSSATAFTESENAELETDQSSNDDDQRAEEREAKIKLINSFEGLDEDVVNEFLNKIDEFEDVKDLELELLKAYKRNTEESAPKPMRAFAFAPITNNAKDSDSLDSWVRKNLK